LTPRQQSKTQPERGTRRGQMLAVVQKRTVHAFLSCQHLSVAASQTGCPGKPMQVAGAQRGQAVRSRQRFERVVPLTTLVTLTPSPQCLGIHGAQNTQQTP